jgi:TonB family protein
VIDGAILEKTGMNEIDPNQISSMNVLKDKSAIEKYGEIGKNGVIEITTKANDLSLIVIDGVVTDKKRKDIPFTQIEKMNKLEGKAAIDKYGDKGKNGVFEITTRDPETKMLNENTEVKVIGYGANQKVQKEAFVAVETLPKFPGGGEEAMAAWISQNVKYPAEAVKGNITGKVFVDFMVSSKGKVKNVQVAKPVHPLLDAEAKRVISNMPDWKPGSQGGKPVDVQMMVPVEFRLD